METAKPKINHPHPVAEPRTIFDAAQFSGPGINRGSRGHIGGGIGDMCVAGGTIEISGNLQAGDRLHFCTLAPCIIYGGHICGQQFDGAAGSGALQLSVGYEANGVDPADTIALIETMTVTGAATPGNDAGQFYRPFGSKLFSRGPLRLNGETIVTAWALNAATAANQTCRFSAVVFYCNP